MFFYLSTVKVGFRSGRSRNFSITGPFHEGCYVHNWNSMEKFILFSHRNLIKLSLQPQELCSCGLCKICQRSHSQELNYRKINHSSNFNYDGKSLVKCIPVPNVTLSWVSSSWYHKRVVTIWEIPPKYIWNLTGSRFSFVCFPSYAVTLTFLVLPDNDNGTPYTKSRNYWTLWMGAVDENNWASFEFIVCLGWNSFIAKTHGCRKWEASTFEL